MYMVYTKAYIIIRKRNLFIVQLQCNNVSCIAIAVYLKRTIPMLYHASCAAIRVSSSGGVGGRFPPNTPASPPKEREKGERERERERERGCGG